MYFISPTDNVACHTDYFDGFPYLMCIEDKLVCIRIHKNLFDRVYHILNRYILAHKYISLKLQMTNVSNVFGYQVNK